MYRVSVFLHSEGTGVTHKVVIEQVRKHAADLEQFVRLNFLGVAFNSHPVGGVPVASENCSGILKFGARNKNGPRAVRR
jgi:hypothetical protein